MPSPTVVLRGNGLGAVAFGASELETVSLLGDMLGEKPTEASVGFPLQGCANLAERTVLFEDSGLVLGLAGGHFVGWTQLSAAFSYDRAGHAIPATAGYRTAAGVGLGDRLSDTDRTASVNLVADTALRAGIDAVSGVIEDRGTILVVAMQGRTGVVSMAPAADGTITMLTAGTGCRPDGTIAVGDAPIGLTYDVSPWPFEGQIRDPKGPRTEWASLGTHCVGVLIRLTDGAGVGCGTTRIELVAATPGGPIRALWLSTWEDGTVIRTVQAVLPLPEGAELVDAGMCSGGINGGGQVVIEALGQRRMYSAGADNTTITELSPPREACQPMPG